MCIQSEANVAQYPINQWIVAGEPNVSKNEGTRGIQQRYIKCVGGNITRWEVDTELYSLGDGSFGAVIEELELEWSNRASGE